MRNIAVVLGDPRLPDPVKRNGTWNEEDLELVENLKRALSELQGIKFSYLNNHATLFQDLEARKGEIDYVFNLCDEGLYNLAENEAAIPLILEELGIPYTGASPRCMETCFDKQNAKERVRCLGVRVVKDFTRENVEYPAIVKPAKADGSWGIDQDSVVYDDSGLSRALDKLKSKYSGRIIIEQYLAGREFTFGLIGNPGNFRSLPLMEITFPGLAKGKPAINAYEAKWLNDPEYGKKKTVAAKFDGEKEIIEGSARIFEELRCRDYARIDWRADEKGRPYFLEANPNPGWGTDGNLKKSVEAGGIEYPRMLELILDAADRRIFG